MKTKKAISRLMGNIDLVFIGLKSQFGSPSNPNIIRANYECEGACGCSDCSCEDSTCGPDPY